MRLFRRHLRSDKNTHINQNPENLSHTKEVTLLYVVCEQQTPSFWDVGSENPVVRKALTVNTRPG